MIPFALYDSHLVFSQAYLLKNDENKAMSPAKLQDELNNILKFNPDFAEAVSWTPSFQETDD